MSELTLKALEEDCILKIIDDYEPSEEILQEMVGGNIEIVTLNNRDILVINREGKRLNLNYNSEATQIYQEQGGMRGKDIVGIAVLVKKGLKV